MSTPSTIAAAAFRNSFDTDRESPSVFFALRLLSSAAALSAFAERTRSFCDVSAAGAATFSFFPLAATMNSDIVGNRSSGFSDSAFRSADSKDLLTDGFTERIGVGV